MKKFFYALRKNHEMRYRLSATEDAMERAAEDYRRALLSGAHLPPMSTVEITVEAIHGEGAAQPDSDG
jgi:hypothetical protein